MEHLCVSAGKIFFSVVFLVILINGFDENYTTMTTKG